MSECLDAEIADILANSPEMQYLISRMFPNEDISVQIKITRPKTSIEKSTEAIFISRIKEHSDNKVVPLVMRKRLLYEQAMQNKVLQKTENIV